MKLFTIKSLLIIAISLLLSVCDESIDSNYAALTPRDMDMLIKLNPNMYGDPSQQCVDGVIPEPSNNPNNNCPKISSKCDETTEDCFCVKSTKRVKWDIEEINGRKPDFEIIFESKPNDPSDPSVQTPSPFENNCVLATNSNSNGNKFISCRVRDDLQDVFTYSVKVDECAKYDPRIVVSR